MDEFPEVKVKTLPNLADHLGVMKLEQRTVIEDVDTADYWDNKQKQAALKKFSMENAQNARDTAQLLLDFAMQLSSLVSLP